MASSLADSGMIVDAVAGAAQWHPNNGPALAAVADVGGTIRGTKWDDANADGMFSTDESLVAGATVFLDTNNSGTLDDGELADITDANGAYEFTALPPGEYVVRELLPSGFEQTFPATDLPLSQVLANLDARFMAVTDLIPNRFDFTGGDTGDYISTGGSNMFSSGNRLNTNLASWIDYTNGAISGGDSSFGTGSSYFTRKYPGLFVMAAHDIGITQFRIAGYTGASGTSTADGAVLTLPNGYTAFVKRTYGGATPSVNHLVLVPGDGSAPSQSFPTYAYYDDHSISGLDGIREIYYLLVASADGGFISDNEMGTIAEAFVRSALSTGAHFVSLDAGQILGGLNFGNREIVPGEIRGTQWSDLNQDGRRGPDEPGVPGGTVFLDGDGDGELDAEEPTTLTDADGNFSFTGVYPGEHIVAWLPQAGWVQTYPRSGSWSVQLGNGELRTDVGFGTHRLQPATLRGTTWDDADGDGIFEPDELPVAGAIIYADANNNGHFDDDEPTGITDADGAYEFTGLPPGNYVIREALAAGIEQTFPGTTSEISQWLANLDASFTAVSDVIPNRFEFSDGVTGYYIWDGGGNMFDSGNYLGTNRASSIYYSDGVVKDGSSPFGTGSSYFTRKYPGLFVLSAQNVDIAEFRISGYTGADGSGTADGVVIPLANGYTAFVKRIFGASTPSINHLVLLPGDGTAQSQTFATHTDSDQHSVTGLAGVRELHYLLFASDAGGFIGDSEMKSIAEAFLHAPLGLGAHFVDVASGQVVTGLDFGSRAILPGEICGAKWSDLNQDARRNPDEPGVAGWTVFLDLDRDGNLDEGEPQTLTDANGLFSFSGLMPGNYVVAELPQAGWVQTYPPTGDWEVRVGNGERREGIDFGNHQLQPGSIGGTKWEDADGDGMFDAGEPLSVGATIYLDANRNGILDDGERTDVTDAKGAYEFTGLPPGSHVVRQVLASTVEQTFPKSAAPLSQILADLDADYAAVNSLIPNRYDFVDGVTGSSILDGGGDMFDGGNYLNTNRASAIAYTAGEIAADTSAFGPGSSYFTQKYPGLFVMSAENIDITEFRLSGNNGADGLGTANGAVIPLSNGYTAFVKRVFAAGVPSINQIMIVPGDGSEQAQSFPSDTNNGEHRVTGLEGVRELHYLLVASANGGFISDEQIRTIAEAFVAAARFGAGAHYVNLFSGQVVSGTDFGARAIVPGEIHGTVWSDLDQDGRRDPGEPGLAGWVVFLDADGDEIVDESGPRTLTDADGNFTFRNLQPATYVVASLPPAGWQPTYPHAGVWEVKLGNGEQEMNVDFGHHQVQPASIRGTKWDDTDGDGLRDPGESPVAGVTIYLDMNGNLQLDDGEPADLTDSQGAYEFAGLLPGDYAVREVLAGGFERTFPVSAPPLPHVLSNLDSGFAAVTGLIPNRFDFSDGVSGTYIYDGGSNMYDYGNYIHTYLASGIGYTGNVITSGDLYFGSGSSYFTRKYPGLFVLSAQDVGITQFRISGNTGASGGTVDGAVITLANGYTAFVKRTYGASTPSVNHILLVPGDGAAQSQTLSNSAYSDEHILSGLNNIREIHYLLVASDGGGFISDSKIRAIADAYVRSAGLRSGSYYVTVTSGQLVSGLDFGNRAILPGEIRGVRWSDLDQDGQRDEGEPGIPERTVFLDLNRNGSLDSGEPRTVTKADGAFVLANVPPGDYQVGQLPEPDWVPTYPPSGAWEVRVSNGESVTGMDFGNHRLQPGSIRGRKWDDADGDGMLDAGESLLAGVTVYLDANHSGHLDAGELTDVTDANGAYEFTGLMPGRYEIREVLPSGFEQTFPTRTIPLPQILANLNAGFAAVTSLIPNRFEFSHGISGNNIPDGGSDMYDNGNYLNTDLAATFTYTTGMIANGNSAFGLGSSYFTHKYPGLFVMSAQNISVSEFKISGNTGANGSGTANGAVIPLANGYTAFVKRIFGTWDPSINQIIIVPGDGTGQAQSFPSGTDSGEHRVTGLGGIREIHYLLVASANGGFISDEQIQVIAEAFVDVAQLGSGAHNVTLGSGQTLTSLNFGSRAIASQTLRLTGSGQVLDLTHIAAPGLQGFVVLDIGGTGSNTLVLDFDALVACTDPSREMFVRADSDDAVHFGSGWSLAGVTLQRGTFFRVLEQNGAKLFLHGPADWQHPLDHLDVDANGIVSPSDALSLVNELNRGQIVGADGTLPEPSAQAMPLPFYDVNGDGRLTAADVLSLINALNSSLGPEGEAVLVPADSVRQGVALPTLAATGRIPGVPLADTELAPPYFPGDAQVVAPDNIPLASRKRLLSHALGVDRLLADEDVDLFDDQVWDLDLGLQPGDQ